MQHSLYLEKSWGEVKISGKFTLCDQLSLILMTSRVEIRIFDTYKEKFDPDHC